MSKYFCSLLKTTFPNNNKSYVFYCVETQVLFTNLSFAVWNLDSIPARGYAKIPLIKAFQGTRKFDVFWMCESLLNKNIPEDDIFINGFSSRVDIREIGWGGVGRGGGSLLYFNVLVYQEIMKIAKYQKLFILNQNLM